ncbi:MAG: hypothetical protein ABIH11_04310 [Candidatus Altiarchaeota archaeon]
MDSIALKSLKVDFKNATVGLDAVRETLKTELSRVQAQLSPGYLFKSDRELSPERRDPVENHVVGGEPIFHAYDFDVGALVQDAERIVDVHGVTDVRNVVVIGNGGSISSSKALYHALVKYSTDERYYGKRLCVVDDMDPDNIASIKRECSPESTIVLVISKSGTTQGVMDSLSQFTGYKVCGITSRKDGRPLYERLKRMVGEHVGDLILEHPPIGGRFTGRTSVGTLPLALLGMSKEELLDFNNGALQAYGRIGPHAGQETNPALMTASVMRYLELKKDCVIIYAPMYSHRFDGFLHLITQLQHESGCKSGEGQAMIAASGPESQHNTNQWFFGGKPNKAGVFFTIARPEVGGLSAFDGVLLEDSLSFESDGTIGDAASRIPPIPVLKVAVDGMTPQAAGCLMAFSQYAFGVYPALLRDLNPFDQPDVVRSKEIARELRSGGG